MSTYKYRIKELLTNNPKKSEEILVQVLDVSIKQLRRWKEYQYNATQSIPLDKAIILMDYFELTEVKDLYTKNALSCLKGVVFVKVLLKAVKHKVLNKPKSL